MFPVEAFRNTLGKAVALFERHAIRFHLTGGLTSVIYAEPRMTQDMDIVIDHQAIVSQLEPFITSLEESDFMFDVDGIRHAVEQDGMFQLFDNTEALKLDVYARELITGELSRSERIEVFDGMQLPVASRADAAISKLVWISKGSHKSRRDLRHMYRRGLDKDCTLIRELAVQLDLETLLDDVLREPDELLE